MCCIAVHAEGVPAEEEALRNLIVPNDDYHGYAMITPTGKIVTDKSPDGEFLLGQFLALRKMFPDGPAVWHSRLSTGSAVTEENGHPLICAADTVLFHNGQLNVGTIASDDPRSDTAVFAQDLFPAFANLDDHYVFSLLEEWATPHNKMVFLTTSERYSEQVYIVNRDQWLVSPGGVLYSNSDFLGQGAGWDEMIRDGDLYRWRVLQPGQCPDCFVYGCASLKKPGLGCQRRMRHVGMPAYRNETKRRAQVEAAGART